MKSTRAALAGLGIAAALVLWLAFGIGGRGGDEESGPRDRLEAELEEEAAGGGREEELEGAPALALEPDPEGGTREPSWAASETGTPPSATAVAASAADAAIVAGLLVDAGTSEPLPHYALRIQDSAKRREDLLTDERGRFRTGSPMADGTIRVTPFDDPAHARALPEIAVERRVVDGEAADVDLSVPCGPTYLLSIASSEAVVPTTLAARLRIRSPDDVRDLGPEPVRAGDPPWVRFAPVPADYDRCDRLELRSQDGLWLGSTGASTLAGVAPGLARVELEARAVLAGKVVDSGGTPVAGASVAFEGTTASGKPYGRKTGTRGDGSYRCEFLSEGTGTVSVRSLGHLPQEAAIRVIGRATTQQDFVLAALPPAGAIRGSVASETGTYRGQVDVVLKAVGGADPAARPPPRTTSVLWEEKDGRAVGAFDFESLPAGEYELSVRDGTWFTWLPRTWNASPPSEDVRFVVHDDLAHAEFVFRPRDAETGAALDASYAWWSVQGAASGSKEVRADDAFLARFPIDRSFRWRLDRAGYRPAFGDEKAFAVEDVRDGRIRRIAEVDLAPGWGEVFRVVRRGNQKPIAGAKILLDGREAGTTKRDGTCLVGARERPDKVDVAYRDWKVESPVDLRPAWRRKEKRFVEIQVVQRRS